MKKNLAVLFAMSVILSIISLGYADENSTLVSMTLGDDFTYSAPPAISMTRNADGTGDVVFNINQLEPGHSISVALVGSNYFDDNTNEFSLVSSKSSNVIKYKIRYNGEYITEGITFATIVDSGEQRIPLVFSPVQSSIPNDVTAAQYSDTITYTITVTGS